LGSLFKGTSSVVPPPEFLISTSKIVDRDKHRKALGEQTDAGTLAQCSVNREKSSQD